MRYYWIRTHRLIRWVFSGFLWKVRSAGKSVYLTFDDGPTPGVTPWVLDQLANSGAKATFFCIGKNISENREVFNNIIAAGHSVGNHTQTHANGWHVPDDVYQREIRECEQELEQANTAKLFRPPYGKVRRSQFRYLRSQGYKIVMWDILTADFDHAVTPEQCLQNVLKNVRSGSIIIFHDSLKASRNLRHALPATLEFLKEKGFEMRALDQSCS